MEKYMHTVRTSDGTRYLLLKQSSDSSLVRDPTTGDERYIENDRLKLVESDNVSPLETVAETVPDSIRRILSAVSDDRSLGLLLVLDRHEPIAIPDLMTHSDLCESDINGILSEFRAAGLIEPVSIGGVPSYETTKLASDGLSILRDCDDDGNRDD